MPVNPIRCGFRALFLPPLVALLGWSASATAENLPTKVGIYPGSLVSFPAFVAQEKGFYQANGLDVSLISIPDGAAMTAAVVSDSVQFGNNAYDNLFSTVSKGLPVKAVVGNTVALPYALIVRSDFPLPHKGEGYPKVMQDLKGANVGVIARGVSTHYLTEKLLTKAGVKSSDVTYLAVGMPASARSAMKNKSIDAYLSLWPLPPIVEATKEGTVIVNLARGEGPPDFKDLGYSLWWASDKTIASNPELVKRFVRATEQSYCWYRDPKNLDELVGILKKKVPTTELSDEQYRTMIRDMLPAYGTAVTEKSVKVWQDLLTEQKQVTKTFKFSDLVAPTAPKESKCS
ncbi:ABC transporter substrate-binding protein [Variovorax sp. J31P179]|uniref:ABC transporter substrate-binding protein n=1 Tax=Variovorax sp. J31P179 TaxID=3053508 RepID=UPI0025749B0E|nr:ABC transporter substrate-binding protein [Variovorax sp. J31P179]MDM0084709.1 ABC transporter substrate-binding protein [Variovorax sp. J31P179]